jgi:hypothetical protein
LKACVGLVASQVALVDAVVSTVGDWVSSAAALVVVDAVEGDWKDLLAVVALR